MSTIYENNSTYIRASTIVLPNIINTAVNHYSVRYVSTSRLDGEIKLRIAPNEIPDYTNNKSTIC